MNQMNNIYYYAIGTTVQELDLEGCVIETCVFLNEDLEFTYDGIQDAIVHSCEASALELAHKVHGKVIRVHTDFVNSLDIKIKD